MERLFQLIRGCLFSVEGIEGRRGSVSGIAVPLLDGEVAPGADVEVVENIHALAFGSQVTLEPSSTQYKVWIFRYSNANLRTKDSRQYWVHSGDFSKLRVVKGEHTLKWGTETVPTGAYAQSALDYLGSSIAEFPGNLYGPAVPWAVKAVKATMCTLFGFFAFAWAATSCVGSSAGFVAVPRAVCFVGFLLILYLVWLEEHVRRYTLICQSVLLAKDKGFRIGGVALPFVAWSWFMRATSLAAHADVLTTSMFAVKVLVTSSCSSTLSALWAWTLRTSALHPYIGVVSFSAIVCATWFLMLGQFVYAAVMTMPKRVYNPHSHEEKPMQYRLVLDPSDIVSYDSLGGTGLNHGHTIEVLADVARMASVTAQRPAFWRKRFSAAPIETASDVGGVLKQAFGKLICFLVCEGSVMLNVQSTGLALSKALDPEHKLDKQIALSLFMSILMAAYNFKQELVLVLAYRKFLRDFSVDRFVQEMEQVGCVREGSLSLVSGVTWEGLPERLEELSSNEMDHQQSLKYLNEILRSQATMRKMMPFFYITWFAWLLLVGRAVVQAVFAALCPEGLHNVGSGCVELPAAPPG